MSIDVTASAETLFSQAGYTAKGYLINAIADIDTVFNEGYAAENPDLIAAYMNAASRDYHSSATLISAQKIQSALYSVSVSIDGLHDPT